MRASIRIGDLARRAKCPVETIRYYEHAGLLPKPTRTVGNYRLYESVHLLRLAFIRNCRSLDMTLDEIRQLLQLRDAPQRECEAAHALIDEHIAHVSARIEDLRDLERQLHALRQQCARPGRQKRCKVLNGLGDGDGGQAIKRVPHVAGAHGG